MSGYDSLDEVDAHFDKPSLLARLDAVIAWIQPRPGTELHAELRAIRAEIEKRDEAVRKFLAKMDKVESSDSYRSVWIVSQLHVGPYNGLTWTEEKARLREALND